MRANTQPSSSSTRTAAINGNLYRGFFQSYGLRENPFSISPDPKYLLPTAQTQEALAQLSYGVTHRKGFMLLSGETGTGKTTVLNSLQEWLRSENIPTVFVFNPHLRMNHVLGFILSELGVPFNPATTDDARVTLIHWLVALKRRGLTAVVILDEAQGFSREMLEEIRMLLTFEVEGEPLLQVILAGQPELERKLRQPELRQLWQRITLRCRMAPFTREQTAAYIASRLRTAGAPDDPVFSSGAVTAVHAYSMGIPRVMNLLCEHSLINAYVENARPIPARIVDEVAREFELDYARSGSRTAETVETEEWFSPAALARAAGNRKASPAPVSALELTAPAPSTEGFSRAPLAPPTQSLAQIEHLQPGDAASIEPEHLHSTTPAEDPCEFAELTVPAMGEPEWAMGEPQERRIDAVRALDDLLPTAPPVRAAGPGNEESALKLSATVSHASSPSAAELPLAAKESAAETEERRELVLVLRRRFDEFAVFAVRASHSAVRRCRYAGEWVRYGVLVSWDWTADRASVARDGIAALMANVKTSQLHATSRDRAVALWQSAAGFGMEICIRAAVYASLVADACAASARAMTRWLRSPMATHRPAARQQFAGLKK
ncbi:MAG TPA: AAA family ATPase [Candidatus Acidoferrales bacterium]|nr:AAA family ATPase [Candidatus Acidoferrales bacterium]